MVSSIIQNCMPDSGVRRSKVLPFDLQEKLEVVE